MATAMMKPSKMVLGAVLLVLLVAAACSVVTVDGARRHLAEEDDVAGLGGFLEHIFDGFWSTITGTLGGNA